MSYQIKVIDCQSAELATALNKPASEGWELISCWPDGERIRAVFQRQTNPASAPPVTRPVAKATPPVPPTPPAAAESSIPPDAKLLDAVIVACRDQPPKVKDGKPLPPGIGLAKLGKEWGMSADKVRAKLQKLGVKEKGEVTSKDHVHKGFFIWTSGNFVNIREAKRKSPTRA